MTQELDVLAARAPSLHSAVLAEKAAGYGHVIIDGTLVATYRVAARCAEWLSIHALRARLA